MKVIKLFLFFVLSLLFNLSVQAQDNQKIDPEKLTDLQLESLDKDVSLDDFQKVELRDYLLESTKKMKNAMESGTNQDEMRFLIDNNTRDLDNKLKEVLTTEQFDKYMQLKRERAINNGNNKSKKIKKKKSE